MYYPSDDLDTPPQPRFLYTSTTSSSGGVGGGADAGRAEDDEAMMMMTAMMDPVTADTSAAAANATGNNASQEDEEEDEEEEEEEEEDEEEDTRLQNTSQLAAGNNILVIPAVSNLDSLYGLREIGREALCWQLSSAKPGNGVEQIRDHSTETYWQSDGTSQPHWVQVHFARRVAISHVCLYLDYNLDESYTPRRMAVKVGMTNQDLVPAIQPPNTLVEFQEPVGWCIVPLKAAQDPLEDGDDEDGDDSDDEEDDDDEDNENSAGNNKKRMQRYVKAHLIQISILSQHQNGRDTHVRQVQLYGPKTNNAHSLLKIHKQQHNAAVTAAAVSNNAHHRKEAANNSDAQSSRMLLQRGRHWDEEFTTVTMSQFSTVR